MMPFGILRFEIVKCQLNMNRFHCSSHANEGDFKYRKTVNLDDNGGFDVFLESKNHMPQLTLIVALDAQRGIGIDNKLPWHLPEDLAHFKRLTSGHPIIMGRKTFDSIGRALPNRRNIVVTRNPDWRHDGVEAVTSLEAALALVGATPAFVIGGAQIFDAAMALARRMVVTEIAHTFDCDTFFPPLPVNAWTETARETHHSDANGYDYAFVTYEKVNH
jgi:dihydrofolate reductase